ncbi:MAG: inorganic phosphate transporter, partial [Chlamydiota bacterium]|nr:inorganic phosphate transporter [Chlamydiota bacterium]
MGSEIIIFVILLAAFYMAWNIGANDVSNAMGTSVGSGALTLFQAVIIAGILEFCGAFFMGGRVSHTFQEGLLSPDTLSPPILLYGMLSALISTALWLQVASYFRWPVSTTHAVVGSVLGFGLLTGGVESIPWGSIGSIASSWVLSPLLSGGISFFLFLILQRQVLQHASPVQAARRAVPILMGVVVSTFTWSLMGSSSLLMRGSVVLIGGLLAWGGGFYFIRIGEIREGDNIPSPHMLERRFRINQAIRQLKRLRGGVSQDIPHFEEVLQRLKEERASCEVSQEQRMGIRAEYQKVEKLFGSLQILTAAYVAFGHGANDVANAIGPAAAALSLLKHGEMVGSVPSWLLALGGGGIVIGLATWGWRVMETIGKKITTLTPTRGFTAEFGAAVTILIASLYGLPISTTHCIVGAVMGVGLARGIGAINLKTLREIAFSWVITLPCSALFSIAAYYL